MKIKNVINKIKCFYYAKIAPLTNGNEYLVNCPCCDWRGGKFLPSGKRNNVLCPNCGSFERHRLYYLYLKNVLPSDIKIKILHFAPEKVITRLFKSYTNAEYLSVDIDPGVAMMQADITNLPFNNNSFDVIFCSHVLEHIIDDNKALIELFRVLKSGCFAIIQVPIKDEFNGKKINLTFEDFSITSPEGREKFFGQSDHVRVCGRDYSDRFKAAGFQVEINKFIENYTV
ncbi:MAG: class I SAM-dependent methyltransferase [Parcubacteria group bacterium]|nr:class I SAM-dependent methyltransferase [Parcubacteria group bacterium]